MKNIIDLVRKHNKYRKESINLLPSENILSKKVRYILSSDLASRYSLEIEGSVHGSTAKNAYGGTRYFDEILHEGERIARDIFNVKFAEIRPLSGHIASMIALLSVTKKGDKIMAIDPEYGGYDGYSKNYLPDMFSLDYHPIPFNPGEWNIDLEKFEDEIKRIKPSTVILGASYILFPYDLKRIREMVDDVNGTLIYDASHVMGLIAGNEFQKDIFKYSHIVYGSTHKSFFGPQGGILLTNDEILFKRIRKNVVWRTMDNYHLNRLAALVQSMVEMKEFGKEYALNVIKNSKKLAELLHEKNFGIREFGGRFTDSHQIFIEDKNACMKLEESNIIIDCVGRMGTNEITRIGMVEKHMEKLSDLIVKAMETKVKKKVIEFRKRFDIKYC